MSAHNYRSEHHDPLAEHHDLKDNLLDNRARTAEDPMRDWLSRRTVLRQLSAGALATLAGLTLGRSGAQAQTAGTLSPAGPARDIDILNFALNAEYLEAEFYTYATTGQNIEALGIAVTGQNGTGTTATPGATTGGAQTNFGSSTLAAIANDLALDERNHVNYIRNVITQLGGTPIAKPTINLAALAPLGVDTTTPNGFLTAGRAFEDTGLSAYAGASQYLSTPSVISGAARILAVEAFHSGNLRLLIAQSGITVPALDALDVPPPPTTANYFTVDANAFAISRTIQQVLYILYGATASNPTPTSGGFFPNGVNANLGLLQLT